MKNYIPELDGLRGIVLFIVLLAHFNVVDHSLGWIWLQSFFVLSGYLISRILLDIKNRPGTAIQKFKIYWIRRSLRIFPVYYLYLFILGIIYLIFNAPPDYTSQIFYLLTYTYNFTPLLDLSLTPIGTSHLWSLSVEEQWYLFIPFVIFIFSCRQLKFISLFFIVFSILFRFYFVQSFEPRLGDTVGEATRWFTCSYFDAFSCGIGINLFSITQWKHRKKILLALFFLVIVAGVINYRAFAGATAHLSGYFTTLGYPLNEIKNYQHLWSYSLVNFFFCLLISVLVADRQNPQSWLNKIFKWRLFTSMGKISYGVYIYHSIILFLFISYPDINPYNEDMDWKTRVGLFLIYFAMVYGVGFLSFRFFELKFLNIKPRYDKISTQNRV